MMEKINLTNYEAFFLDKAEGNLTEKQEAELQEFLFEYPELKAELEEFTLVTIEEEPIFNVDLKKSLKREEETALPLIDYLMIAEVEGSITIEEKQQLSDLVKENPSLMDDLAIYHKAKFSAEETVLFPNKSNLLQKERKLIVWWKYSAAAAAAILFIFLWNGNQNEYYSPRMNGYSSAVEDLSSADDNQLAFIVEKEEDNDEVIAEPKQVKTVDNQLASVNRNKNSITPEFQQQKEDEVKQKEIIPDGELAQKNKKEENSDEGEHSFGVDANTLADASSAPNGKASDEFVPIKEFAKDKIKTDLLKGKTFSETVMDELEEASNEKISFKRETDRAGNTQKFAINIGKFSLSRNK